MCGAYKPPSLSDELFDQDCTMVMDKISEQYEHFILLGDLNFNMLDGPKSEKVSNVCDLFDLSNVVKDPNCFTSRNQPTLLDVILVNSSSYIGKIFHFNCGLSDVHNLIGFQLNIDIPKVNQNGEIVGVSKMLMLKILILN